MPLFEIETDSHIIITWAADEDSARDVVKDSYPHEPPLRVTRRPRDTWVISKAALGISGNSRPLPRRPRLPVEGRRRQGPRHPPLHAAHRLRPGTLAESDRVEHGDGLVSSADRLGKPVCRPIVARRDFSNSCFLQHRFQVAPTRLLILNALAVIAGLPGFVRLFSVDHRHEEQSAA